VSKLKIAPPKSRFTNELRGFSSQHRLDSPIERMGNCQPPEPPIDREDGS
jgi:hypothetical protein